MQNAEQTIDVRYYLADNLFFLVEQGKVIVWNYESHEQYELEQAYFNELLYISQCQSFANEAIFQDLYQAGLITDDPVSAASWGWDLLSKIFHVGTSNVYVPADGVGDRHFAAEYLKKCETLDTAVMSTPSVKPGETVALPSPDLSELKAISFYDVISRRKTCRDFYGQAISLDKLSSLLFASFGCLHGDWDEFAQCGLKKVAQRKAFPSAGGTHSEEVYLIAFRISGLEPGLYHYRSHDHQLTLLKAGNFETQMIEMNYQQDYSAGLAFGIYLTARFEKIWWKYKHSRSYRAALLDIGHASQGFLTAATGVGLQTWLTAAFVDREVISFLSLDGDSEYPILFVGAGYGSNQAIPSSVIEYLNR